MGSIRQSQSLKLKDSINHIMYFVQSVHLLVIYENNGLGITQKKIGIAQILAHD